MEEIILMSEPTACQRGGEEGENWFINRFMRKMAATDRKWSL